MNRCYYRSVKFSDGGYPDVEPFAGSMFPAKASAIPSIKPNLTEQDMTSIIL